MKLTGWNFIPLRPALNHNSTHKCIVQHIHLERRRTLQLIWHAFCFTFKRNVQCLLWKHCSLSLLLLPTFHTATLITVGLDKAKSLTDKSLFEHSLEEEVPVSIATATISISFSGCCPWKKTEVKNKRLCRGWFYSTWWMSSKRSTSLSSKECDRNSEFHLRERLVNFISGRVRRFVRVRVHASCIFTKTGRDPGTRLPSITFKWIAEIWRQLISMTAC